jgi:hypothetical protein
VHWSTPFEDPIILPDGRKLLTLKDAADYTTKLQKRESDLPEWQAAIEALMLCGRGDAVNYGFMTAGGAPTKRLYSRCGNMIIFLCHL